MVTLKTQQSLVHVPTLYTSLLSSFFMCASECRYRPILIIENQTNEPIWIGITHGTNVIFKNKLEPIEWNKQAHCTLHVYDRVTNPLGIDVRKDTCIFIWLTNPEHKCVNPDRMYPIKFLESNCLMYGRWCARGEQPSLIITNAVDLID